MAIQKPRMKYKGQWVYTTKEVADICESNVVNIHRHLECKRDKFIEGRHLFKLVGDDLREFRSRYSDLVYKSGNSLILWTRYGLLRLCKMFNTAKAWEVMEAVADCDMKESWWSKVKDWVKEKKH